MRRITARGIAGLLVRGIRVTYAPEHQQAEIDRLSEYLEDLAASLFAEAEDLEDPDDHKRALSDSHELDLVVRFLEGVCHQCDQPATERLVVDTTEVNLCKKCFGKIGDGTGRVS